MADADPMLTQSFRAIPAFGGRILKVVHRPDGPDVSGHYELLRQECTAMITTYDPDADAFYARFAPATAAVVETREVAPGVMIDLDASGQLVGVEVLNVTTRGQGGSVSSSLAAE